mmetsp:Transcript_27902/g.28186  ORF Transcript_27902/g.28186 Transcript_27902/m.28186 type:complete len:271 (+) Transcript_27902:305-1117(+)
MEEYSETETNDLETLAIESLAEIETLEKELGLIDINETSFSYISYDADICITPYSSKKNKSDLDQSFNVDYSFGLAEAESERERMQDKYNQILCRNEELEERHQRDLEIIEDYHRVCQEEKKLRDHLTLAIEQRDEAITMYEKKCSSSSSSYSKSPVSKHKLYQSYSKSLCNNTSNQSESITISLLRDELDRQRKQFDDMEFRLAQAKCALANAQQSQEDFIMAQEIAERERDKEHAARLLAEKERDAYSIAYEASLKQFGKTKQNKNKR